MSQKVIVSQSDGHSIFAGVLTGSRTLFLHGLAMLTFCAVCLFLQTVDSREYLGASLWLKPTKFFFSFAIHALTVSWAMFLLPRGGAQRPLIKWSVVALLVTSWFELIYITYRASQGEPSHFNIGSWLGIAFFAAMACAAVTLVTSTAIIGYAVWKSRPDSLVAQAIALGFGLSAVLTTFVGLSIGENLGPWVGADKTNANGLPFFRWSTTVGDLRVSHFFSTHLVQFVPATAFFGSKPLMWFAVIAGILATLATFVQASLELPFLSF